MPKELLIDIADIFEMADSLFPKTMEEQQAPILQVLATLALCERLDEVNKHLLGIRQGLHGLSSMSGRVN